MTSADQGSSVRDVPDSPHVESEAGGKPQWNPPATWLSAFGRALVVLVYFAVATVWLPSYLIGSTTDEGFRDIVVSVSWLATFGGGIWALRELQRRGWL